MTDSETTRSAILAGIDHELLILANKARVSVVGVTDNRVEGMWQGYHLLSEDAVGILELNADGVIIGIDSPAVKKKLDVLFGKIDIQPVSLIGGEIDSLTQYEPGLVLQTSAVVSVNCKLGRCVKVNTAALLMHDVMLGDYVTVAPRAVLLGRVSVMEGCFIGANATILPDVTIGRKAVVGAGAVVTRDVPDGVTVVGVPAKNLKK